MGINAQTLIASEKRNCLLNHELSLDIGSIRLKYPYPITEIKYASPLLKKVNLKFSLQIRSYGTWYFVSTSAYDFTPMVEYYFTKTVKPVYFSASLGLDARLRLSNDVRSEATTSMEPIVGGALHGNYKNFFWNMPLWTRFYSNGISFTIKPELAYQVSPRVSLFFRDEISVLQIYKPGSAEIQQDCFIGAHIFF